MSAITHKDLQKATALMKCMAHPLRLALLCHLSQAKELSAGDLVTLERSRAGQPQVSQYLGQLRTMGLVKTRREGQMIYYRLTAKVVQDVLKTLAKHYCPTK